MTNVNFLLCDAAFVRTQNAGEIKKAYSSTVGTHLFNLLEKKDDFNPVFLLGSTVLFVCVCVCLNPS